MRAAIRGRRQGIAMRRAAKVDSNHHDIVKAYRKGGWSVYSTAQLGDGFPDLVVAPPWDFDGVFLIEVKQPKGKTRDKQDQFAKAFPVKVIRTVEDAEEHMEDAHLEHAGDWL